MPVMAQFSLKNVPIKVGYYSNMFRNPGLSIGTEYVLTEKGAKSSTNTISKGIVNLKKKSWLINTQLGAYTHVYSHSVLFLNSDVRYCKTTPKGRKYFVGLGFSLERSFLPETYEVNANGNIEKIVLPGHFYAGTLLAFGTHFKHRFFKSKNELFAEFQIPLLIGYNNTLLPKINFAFGMLFNRTTNHELSK